jgi:hypothetical protein
MFKPGDEVYATKNSVWGDKPMKVIRIHHDSTVSTKHPSFGTGWFYAKNLTHSSSKLAKRNLKLRKEIEFLEKKVKSLRKKLCKD